MRKTLEDFYYGSITPCERQMTPNSELKRAADRVVCYESQLTEQLDAPERTILEKGNPAQDLQLGADDLPAKGNGRSIDPGTRQTPQQSDHVSVPGDGKALRPGLSGAIAQNLL